MSLPADELAYQEAHIHDNKQSQLIVSSAICMSLALIAVPLRFWSRRIGGSKLGADDWMIIVGLVG
jgi:hypothetical protein